MVVILVVKHPQAREGRRRKLRKTVKKKAGAYSRKGTLNQ
jgi:hypothetical protein